MRPVMVNKLFLQKSLTQRLSNDEIMENIRRREATPTITNEIYKSEGNSYYKQ